LEIRVIPRAGVTKFAGVRDNRLLIRLAAAPVDGAANDALIAFLSEALGIPSRNISIAAGEHSRNKTVVLSGMSAEEAERRLKSLL
jgi:uncharacterized protein YggU (UPF0235/DUF167 family)